MRLDADCRSGGNAVLLGKQKIPTHRGAIIVMIASAALLCWMTPKPRAWYQLILAILIVVVSHNHRMKLATQNRMHLVVRDRRFAKAELVMSPLATRPACLAYFGL
jgi:hypothetical protein